MYFRIQLIQLFKYYYPFTFMKIGSRYINEKNKEPKEYYQKIFKKQPGVLHECSNF